MNDRVKTKTELIEEISCLNQRIKELEQSESDCKNAEKALRESEEFFRQIFDQAAVGMAILSPEGVWLQVNRRLCDMLGYSCDELKKRHFRDFTHPDHVEQDMVRVRQMVEGVRNADSWEKRFIRRDGRDLWVRITTALSRDEHGHPKHFISVTEDITDGKRADEALRILTSRQEAMLAAVPEIIVEVDNNKVYTWANSVGVEFFGGDVVGKEAAFYFEGEQETYKTVQPLFNGIDDIIYVESWQRRRDGAKRLLAWWCRVLKDERGQVTGALSSARDITEQKRAEEALIESEQKYKLLVENAEEVVYVIQDGVFRFANSMCGRVLDFPVAALMGLPMLDFVHPDDRKKAISQHRRMLDGEQDAQRTEFRVLTRKGEMRWADVNSVAIDWDGKKATLNIATDITERKRAEQALRLSETFLDSVIEHSPHAMWISDYRGTLIRLNKACRELLHMADDDVVGKYNVLQDSIVSEQGYLPLVKRVFEQGETVNFTMEYDSSRLKNLALRNPVSLVLDITISPVLDVDGRVMHAIIQHIDITDQKQAEKALTQSEEKFRKAFYTSPDSVNINRLADGMYVSINPGFTRITGYTEKDIIGKTSIECNIWANIEDRQRLVEGLCKDGEVSNLEACFRMKSGDIRYGLMSASMIDLDGVPHILSITRDITERKRAEEALRENEEKYRLLADNADDVIFVLDMNLNYTYISPSVRILRGYEPEEIFTQQSLETLTSDSRDLALKALSEIMELEKSGGEKVPLSLTLPLEMRRKDGSTVWTEVKFSFIRDEDGQPVGILGVTRDISDRRRAEEERKRLQSQLVQAQKMESVGRLAGGVAHDFNNMLGVIIGHAELALLRADPAHPIHAHLQAVRKAAERSANLTQQLLAFARKQNIAPKVIDLNETVEGMFKMMRRLIGEDIDLIWLPRAALWRVKVDPAQVDQLLANLCVNARDAVTGVGKVTIETDNVVLDADYCTDNPGCSPGEYVLLAVSDNGCGMDQEIMDKMFEPFFTTKEVGKGTGLGLSMVYGIVKQNNGFIKVHSEPGNGSTFKIYLPRYEDKVEHLQPADQLEPPTRGHETILLVEDDPEMLKTTQILLQHQGYIVLTASAPGEAVRLAERYGKKIDLLVTDVIMPEMSGRDLHETLLHHYTNLKCLFMSGYTTNVIAHHGVLDEGVHFIQKPFSINNLATKIREALNDRQ